MNYSELSQAIQDYMETTEATFVSNIPNFVRQAEERINRAIIIPSLRKQTTLTTTAANDELTKPSDFLAVLVMSVNDGSSERNLLRKDLSFLSEAYPGGTQGVPSYFADKNQTTWRVIPVPNDAYTVTLNYLYDPASIVTSSTSWLGDNAESVLLSACLLEAYTFQKGDPDMMEHYSKRYMDALDDLVRLGQVKKVSEYRSGE